MYDDHTSYQLKKQWEKEDKQDRYKVAAGVMDFVGVVAGVLCILLLIALLMSLLDWLNKDISSTFATLRAHFQ